MLRWFHLVAMSVWVGGLITMGAIVAALRSAGAERELLRAAARAFGRLQWSALAVAVLTGAWMALDHLDQPALAVKVAFVAAAAGLAAWHQFAAAGQSSRMRGVLQAAILVMSLGAVGAAIAL
jgi:uncharacterized membrane protein